MEPFDEFEKMLKRYQYMFGRMVLPLEEEIMSFGTFPVDISESDDSLMVKANLPGFEKDDISVKSTETTLSISAQHKEKKIQKTEKMFRVERRMGAVRREFMLPLPVKPETSKADYKDGVLTVKLEKKDKKKIGKEIKIV